MASRENQGLQVALILFVMITIALGVFSYIFYDRSTKATAEKERAEKSEKIEKRKHEALSAQNQILKYFIGTKELSTAELNSLKQEMTTKGDGLAEETAAIEVEFKKDLALFQNSSTELGTTEGFTGQQNWISLSDYLVNVIRNRNTQIQDHDNSARVAEAERDSQVKAATDKVVVAETGLATTQAEKDAEKAKFDTERGRFTTETGKMQTTIGDKDDAIEKAVDDGEKIATTLKGEIKELATLNVAMRAEVKQLRKKDFDVPDGQIRWIDQRSGIVFIDLGALDGLRRQQTFSVYDRETSNQTQVEPKATIEVTRIIERHLAEARIVQDEVRNPILTEDLIFTPAWAAGRQIHFALAGFMDIDGDERSDRDTVRRVIQLNGGVIDAEISDEGERLGSGMTVHTRYLVVGERPTDKTAPKARNEYSSITDEAVVKGVETVSVHTLLGWMGYKGDVKTQRFGDSDSYKPSSSNFKPRRPGRGSDGAY